MKTVRFEIQGRFGHFLRAEANASAPTYPVPPRTTVLGLIGAILGLLKDEPQELLEPARIALAGPIPQTHWHKAKLRKDPPAALPHVVKQTQKAEQHTKPEKATLIGQEWLIDPAFTVWASLPDEYHSDFEERVRERHWHFNPCFGISEHMANVIYEESVDVKPLPEGLQRVKTFFPEDIGDLEMDLMFQDELILHALRMPRTVTAERVFTHANYLLERNAKPVPIKTDKAFQAGNTVITFL